MSTSKSLTPGCTLTVRYTVDVFIPQLKSHRSIIELKQTDHTPFAAPRLYDLTFDPPPPLQSVPLSLPLRLFLSFPYCATKMSVRGN